MRITRSEFLKRMGIGAAGLMVGGNAFAEVRRAQPVAMPQIKVDPGKVKAVTVNDGPGFGRRLALTFDDGPDPKNTPIVLKALRERNVQATFFMIGRNVNAHPDLAAQVLAEGHELANHSYTHPKLSSYSNTRVISELERCQEAIEKATGTVPCWFRPPYGAWAKTRQGPLAVKESLGVAMWSVDTNDWRDRNTSVVTRRAVNNARPGSIILMHDIHRTTALAVAPILDGLLDQGYEMSTMSGFLGHPYA